MPCKIFVIEDDDGIRETLQIALQSFSYDVMVFSHAEAAITAAKDDLPDLFLFDILLPGMSGLEAVRCLRQKESTAHTPILLLTAKDTESDKVIGLDAGADDYIVKPFGIMELAARIRALLRRFPKENPVLSIGDLTINSLTREVLLGGHALDLTFKEFELLFFLMQNSPHVVTREKLLDRIWGIDFVGETRTLDAHIKSLRKKLGDSTDSPRYIFTVRNVGYKV